MIRNQILPLLATSGLTFLSTNTFNTWTGTDFSYLDANAWLTLEEFNANFQADHLPTLRPDLFLA